MPGAPSSVLEQIVEMLISWQMHKNRYLICPPPPTHTLLCVKKLQNSLNTIAQIGCHNERPPNRQLELPEDTASTSTTIALGI